MSCLCLTQFSFKKGLLLLCFQKSELVTNKFVEVVMLLQCCYDFAANRLICLLLTHNLTSLQTVKDHHVPRQFIFNFDESMLNLSKDNQSTFAPMSEPVVTICDTKFGITFSPLVNCERLFFVQILMKGLTHSLSLSLSLSFSLSFSSSQYRHMPSLLFSHSLSFFLSACLSLSLCLSLSQFRDI